MSQLLDILADKANVVRLNITNQEGQIFGSIYELNGEIIFDGYNTGEVIQPGLYAGDYLVWSGSEWVSGGTGIHIGSGAGQTGQSVNAVAIGIRAGQTNQGSNAVAVGTDAGFTGQSSNAVAIGRSAGKSNQGSNAIAIGAIVGFSSQGSNAIAIGTNTGFSNQGSNAVAVGTNAGFTGQSSSAVAIGNGSGYSNQGSNAVAIGRSAGNSNQGSNAVAIGRSAGNSSQSSNSVAIGNLAGNSSQGTNSIAIGTYAGYSSQKDNTIVLNATGVFLNGDGNTGALYIAPIRNDNTQDGYLSYNILSNEVVYNNSTVMGPTGPTGIATQTLAQTLTLGNTANMDIQMSGYNLKSTGDLTVGSTGILNLVSATYITCENLNINNSAITKQGTVSDITFDDLASINTNSTSTPLTIGCGTSINIAADQYPIGLAINDVINSGQPSTGIVINNTLSADDETNGLVVSSINQPNTTSRNTNGVYINKLSTKNSPLNAILIDNIEVSDNPGVASAINVGTVQAINDADIVGIQVSALNSAGGATTLMNCDNVNALGTAKGINLALVNSLNKDAYGIVIDTVSGRDSSVGLQVLSVNAGPGNSGCYGIYVNNVNAEVGDAHCVDIRGAVANNGNSIGVNVDTHQARNKVWGLSIDNLTSTSNDEVTGLYIGSSINTTGIARGIHQIGTPINILEGGTTIGGATSSSQNPPSLSMTGTVKNTIQYTGTGATYTLLNNAGNIVISQSGNDTINLPTLASRITGAVYTIVKQHSNSVTIQGSPTNQINGPNASFNFGGFAYSAMNIFWEGSSGFWFAYLI